MCVRVSYVYVSTHTHTRVTHTIIENNFTVCVERKREVEKGTKEEPATDRWGKGGPACEREREGPQRRRVHEQGRESDKGTDGDMKEKGEEKEVEFWWRWGMSRRVVCSHGSSLGTAVQYAGQGKVTLLYVVCVCLCVCMRLLARTGAHYYLHPRMHI